MLVVFVYAFATACTVILAMAFFLELFNANESASFVEWVYRATARIMQPFRGIFPTIEGENGSVFDPSLLFAMFMYWLLAIATHALIDWIDRRIAVANYQEGWNASQHTVSATAAQSPPAPSAPPAGPAGSSKG